jgi:hypothetical protein
MDNQWQKSRFDNLRFVIRISSLREPGATFATQRL